jgi:hypothetical protein
LSVRWLVLAIAHVACVARQDPWHGGPGAPLDQGPYGSVPAGAAVRAEPAPMVVVEAEARVVAGLLEAAEVEAVADMHRSQLAYCYTRAKVKNPTLGTHALTLRLALHRDAPDVVDVVASDLPKTDPSVPDCVRTAVGSWSWRPPRSDVDAELVLRFSPA